MNNTIGSASFGKQTWTYPNGKPPKYTIVYTGTQAECNTSGSVYGSKGWDVEYANAAANSSNFWTMTATLNQEVGGDGITPLTGAGAFNTVNWSLHYNTDQKDMLQCLPDTITWINQIDGKDKVTLEKLIANPPDKGNSQWSSASADLGVNWNSSDTGSAFYGSNSTSIQYAQQLWSINHNGVKTMPIVGQVLRQSVVVPNSYNLTTFNSNLDRVYSKSSVQSEIGVPSNWYSIMQQPSDPSNVPAPGGQSLSLIYGWRKEAPSQDQNGATIRVEQDWTLGLYYTSLVGSRL